MSLLSKFKKFLSKHGDELNDIVSVLRIVVPALPMDRQDKRRAMDILDKLAKSSESISRSAERIVETDEVPLKEELVETAVGTLLPGILSNLLKPKSKAKGTK